MNIPAFLYPRGTEAFPSKGKFTIILTYILSFLGILFGISFLIISRGSPYFSDSEIDDLPDFGPFFKWVGTVFVVLAIISFVVNLFFINKMKIGWFLLSGMYLGGLGLTIYALYILIKFLASSDFFAIPIPFILVLAIGIIGIYTLFHRDTFRLFFPKFLHEKIKT